MSWRPYWGSSHGRHGEETLVVWRPLSAAASTVSSAVSSVASATTSTFAAIPEGAERTSSSLRASAPGIPEIHLPENPLKGLNLHLPHVPIPHVPIPKIPEIHLPEIKLPEIQLPKPPPVPRVQVHAKMPKNFGVPFGEFIGLAEGMTLLPEMEVNVFVAKHAEEIAEDAVVRDLSKAIDIDKLRVAFFSYAGPDKRMDEEEFKTFIKRMKLDDAIGAKLWKNLDKDRSGIIDEDEMIKGLQAMTNARAWLRWCPTCDFDDSCKYCIQVTHHCDKCTNERWCPQCWAEHPDRDHDRHLGQVPRGVDLLM